MKRQGFTLVELLAVIIILAVILTIAVPAVKKTVDSAKKKSAENDALMIKNIAEKYYTSNLDKDEEITGIDLSTDTLSYSGEKTTKGYLYFTEDGIAYGKMYINGYCVEVKSDGTNTSEKVSIDDCNIADISTGGNTSGGNQGGSGSTEVTKTYTNGEVVYYNPVTNTKCNSSEAVSTTGTKEGCMRWYAFLDDVDSSIKLLLDHNIDVNCSSSTRLTTLQSSISSWDSSVKNTARLIEASEIVKMTGFSNWTDNAEDFSGYYLHNNSTSTVYKGSAGTNKYSWLFDNTDSCTTYGCNVANSTLQAAGYWTNTKPSPGDAVSCTAWYIDNSGKITLHYGTDWGDYVGIRPVIEVSKSKLK